MISDAFLALLFAGIPTFAITFVLMSWAYSRGVVDEVSDNKDNDMGSDLGFDSSQDTDCDQAKTGNPLLDKWITFGGGYYGLMALCTYFHVEALEIMDFLVQFQGIQDFINTVSSDMLIAFLVNSLTNFITAFVWFQYWPNIFTIGNGWVWIGVSYGGFYLAELSAEQYAKYKQYH